MNWKDIVGYEGIYEVSDAGEVRSKEGKTTYTERHGVRRWKQRVLKQKTSKDNTCRVSLWKSGKEQTWLVHRLVALAFIPMIDGKEYINHIDGSRLNNHVANLEWCNHAENSNHAFDMGLVPADKIVLVHKETKEAYYFRSKSYASVFLGKNNGYLSGELIKGRTELDDYLVFMEPGNL